MMRNVYIVIHKTDPQLQLRVKPQRERAKTKTATRLHTSDDLRLSKLTQKV